MLYILKGLPGSGKSTVAEEMVMDSQITVRLNRDLLRTMLHFGRWSPINEKVTVACEEALASLLLTKGFDVIIDDTNLNPEILEKWKHFTEKTEVIDFTSVPVEECIRRDSLRNKPVGEQVIRNFNQKYL